MDIDLKLFIFNSDFYSSGKNGTIHGDSMQYINDENAGTYIELAYSKYTEGDYRSAAFYLDRAGQSLGSSPRSGVNEYNNYKQSILLLAYLLANHCNTKT